MYLLLIVLIFFLVYLQTYTSTAGTGPSLAHAGRYFIYLEADYVSTGGNAVLSVKPYAIKSK